MSEALTILSDPGPILDHVPFDQRTGPPLVGRREDLARLEDAVLTEGQHVLVSGDAGIGKTRFLAELASRAERAGWRVLTGHCVGEAGASLPYLPFSEIVGALAAEGDVLEEVLEASPGVAHLLPGRRPPAEGSTQVLDRASLYAALQLALETVAKHGPLLIVIEDVHWSDESSRDLLTLLLTRGFRERVSIAVSYRSDDLHRRHPLHHTLGVWSRVGGLRRLELGPLPDLAMSELVHGIDTDRLDDGQVVDVVRRAEGNAFFAEELAAAASAGREGASQELSRLLLLRVEDLDDDAQTVVRLAAVAGRRISHDVLARVTADGAGSLDRSLRAAVDRHVLVPTGRDAYTFRHALLAEAVYDELLPGERVRAHQRYVDALTQAPSMGTAADLARHADAVGDRTTAGRASVDAGEAAMRLAGPAEALRHFERALTLLCDEDEDELDSVTIAAARAATAKGRVDRALALLRSRLDRPGRMAPLRRAELLGRLAYVARLTEEDVDALAMTEEGLALATEDGPVRANLLALRAEALLDGGEDESAAQVADEAMELSARLDLQGVQTHLTGVIAKLVERGGDPEESLRRLETLVEQPGAASDTAILRAMHQVGSLHYRQSRLREALAAYLRGAERAREVGLMWAPYGHDCRTMAATVAYEVGEWDRVGEIVDYRGERPPAGHAAAFDAVQLYVVAGRGELPEPETFPRVREHWQVDGLIAVQSGSARIDLLGHAGRLDEAKAAREELVDFLRRLWHREHGMVEVRLNALLLGQLAAHAHAVVDADRPALTRFADRLREEGAASLARGAAQHVNVEGRAWEARLEAEWLRLRWRAGLAEVGPDALMGAFAAAAGLFEERGDPYEWARSTARLAEVEVVTGRAEEAAGHVAAARAVAERLRAQPLLRELDEVGAAPEAAESSPRLRSPALTPRELEVLRLLDAGRSNGQIGKALFISTKTASVHVSNILAKLGAASRGEAVAEARRQGLLAG